ncbi:MAG TPA: type I 3-dehydroquinate dehydratase, partial [Desulfobaccales bacterium]|nr:type I 3-dehydroquinate dehydratase [Desulfobaccales bacterium]
MFENRKPKTENRKPPLRICVPIVEATVNRARGKYQRAARKGLWTEIRLDYLEEPTPDLQKLFRTLPGPVIATNRLFAEGGRWQSDEAGRLALLAEALDLGVTCLDVELAADASFRRDMWSRRGKTRLMLSWHDFGGTPDAARLEAILDEMLASEADVVKLVALANDPADNVRMLSLIPRAKAQGKDIIAFCMGPLGKWSRIAAPLLGSWLTFAPFSQQGASAPGQLTVNDVK